MAKPAKKRSEDTGSDSLGSYMRQIGQIGALSGDELQKLCQDFEAASSELRRFLGGFGFVAAEYIRLIEECISGNNDPADLFMPSSFQRCGDKKNVMGKLTGWLGVIREKYAALNEAFNAGRDCSGLRRELCDILVGYELVNSFVAEYIEIIGGYIRMADGGFDPLCGKCCFANAAPETVTLIENKLLMHLDELPDAMSTLADLQEKVKVLRNRMVEGNLRLVISIAQKYRNRGVPFNDLIQEGNLGLLRALERFDFNLGYQFSTYASWWIKHNISRVIAEQSRMIRLPGHMIKTINDINRTEQRFIQTYGREPDSDELAKLMELPKARVSAIRKMAMQTISLQSPVGKESDGTVLEDLVAAADDYEPSRELSRRILYDKLHEMLRTLPEREQQIIIMRFGLYGQPRCPLTEISQHFNLTRERVRQLEIKILATLRSPERLKYIDGCIHLEEF